jgi:hypothetical protein
MQVGGNPKCLKPIFPLLLAMKSQGKESMDYPGFHIFENSSGDSFS